MKIISSTDNKYIGMDIPEVNKGDNLTLIDFTFNVEFKRTLENGNISLGNQNFQLQCEE